MMMQCFFRLHEGQAAGDRIKSNSETFLGFRNYRFIRNWRSDSETNPSYSETTLSEYSEATCRIQKLLVVFRNYFVVFRNYFVVFRNYSLYSETTPSYSETTGWVQGLFRDLQGFFGVQFIQGWFRVSGLSEVLGGFRAACGLIYAFVRGWFRVIQGSSVKII